MNVKALINRSIRWLQTRGVPVVQPTLRRVVAHDPDAYTQGLCFVDGALYESTGTWEASSLRRVCPETGRVLEMLAVPGEFAEDIAFLDGHLYQLTWTGGRVIRYRLSPLARVDQGRWEGEGWGLAAYRGQLLASDGSHRLRLVDAGLNARGTVRVRRFGLPVRHLNALDVVDGDAYVNIWCTPLIARIEVRGGRLKAIVDCSELVRLEAPRSHHHILNGIAHVPATDCFLVTGKRWRNMFEIRLDDGAAARRRG